MAGPDSFMPYYGDDFQADTTHCTAMERGAYHDLLWACWKRKNHLPSAPDQLMRMARCTLAEWKHVRETVMTFFIKTSNGWEHKRVGEELAKATKLYDAKVRSANETNEKRRAKRGAHRDGDRDGDRSAERTVDRDAEADVDRNVTHNSHSSSDEKHPSDVLAKPRKRKSQIPHDWKPNEKDIAHATAREISQQTVENLIEPFRDHHIAKQTLSADFSANWRTWVANHINFHGTGPWPRNDAGRSSGHVSRSPSPTAARDSILAKAGLLGGNDHKIRDEGAAWTAGIDGGKDGSGPIIDGDFRERSAGTSDGTEGAHEAEPGDNDGFGGTIHSVSEAPGGLAGGRGALRNEDATGSLALVACMAGTEGPIGDAHLSASDDAGNTDGLETPGFLRRTA